MQNAARLCLLLFVALIFGASCGQSDQGSEQSEAETNTAVPTPSPTIDLLGSDEGIAESESPLEPALDGPEQDDALLDVEGTAALPGEVDANGVPVGFTEAGYPYRGNPNATVVIEEFSDYQ